MRCSAPLPKYLLSADIGRPAGHRIGIGCKAGAQTGQKEEGRSEASASDPGEMVVVVTHAPLETPSGGRKRIILFPRESDRLKRAEEKTKPPFGEVSSLTTRTMLRSRP